MPTSFKVLIIEDNEFDRALCQHLLEQTGIATEIHTAVSCATGLKTLAEHPLTDCILLDLHLPDRLGSEAIADIHRVCPQAAVVILTGESDQRTALDCLKKGADDYLVKGEYTAPILSKTLRYAVERRKAYLHTQKLQLELKQQQELNEIQQEFICLVAHEFKTPLGIISSATQLLEASNPELPLLERQCSKITIAIKRLSGLMDNVLLLRKTEDQKLAGEVTQFDMVGSLHEVCERINEEHAGAQIILHSDVDALTCAGNALLYEYAISNIIKNAIKYSPSGAGVEIHIAQKKQYATIRITDHGRGMSNDTLARIGERFMRGEGTFSQAGIGLGLFLATQFVSHNRGAMYICSEEGKGTSVMVTWPLATSATALLIKRAV